MDVVSGSTGNLRLLSELLFTDIEPEIQAGDRAGREPSGRGERIASVARSLTLKDLEDLRLLATANHVIVRTFAPLASILETEGQSKEAGWLREVLREEQTRIDHALGFLSHICAVLESTGLKATVIKSLDHWPDLGSDLDLYTDADPGELVAVMRAMFNARVDDRSWGDRLANKWNFVIPGLPELVEIHVGRLGQTGEQIAITRSLSKHARETMFGRYALRVTAPEDRIVISTLQRMYRHFYIRLCDVADNARLLDNNLVEFEYLHSLSAEAGLWCGVATYLGIVSDYVEAYRGYGAPLSSLVKGSVKFGMEKVRFRNQFLRVPILPQSLNLYAGELKALLLRGDFRNTLRLSLLPGLATAAAVEQKLTGNDKGVW